MGTVVEASAQLRISFNSHPRLVDPSDPSRQPPPAQTCRPLHRSTTMALAFRVRSPSPPFEKFSKSLSALSEPFWDHHHTLLSARTEKPIKLIGKSRLEEFFINTLYPLHPENWAEFQKIRAAAPNQKVERSCERLFGSLANAKPYLKFAWQQQALLQVYQDFCLEDVSDCSDCSFPEQLAQWKSTDD